MRATNLTRNRDLATDCRTASRFHQRLIGLLGRKRLPEGEGLWIEPCNSVHTWFLGFPLDVAFLDREGEVVALHTALRPFSATRPNRRARVALELPAGTLAATGTLPGDRIVLTKP